MNHISKFAFRDRVLVDGDSALVAAVTGFMFREGAVFTEICWMSNGESKEARIEEWRLTLSERDAID